MSMFQLFGGIIFFISSPIRASRLAGFQIYNGLSGRLYLSGKLNTENPPFIHLPFLARRIILYCSSLSSCLAEMSNIFI